MIRVYHKKTNAAREHNQMNPISTNIKYYRKYTIKIKDKVHFAMVSI